MVPIIVLLALALLGVVYLQLSDRKGAKGNQYRESDFTSHVERIADGIRSIATGRAGLFAASASGRQVLIDGLPDDAATSLPEDDNCNGEDPVIADLKSILPVDMDGEGWLYIPGKLKRITLDDILFHIHNLSLQPSTNLPVISEINRWDSSPDDVARVIEDDWSLSNRILKLANSAYAGLGEEVRDINRAINLLGFETVRSLIYLNRMMESVGNTRGPLEAEPVFMHCLATSCAAPLFTGSLMPAEANLVITAGLFHDIGKVLCSQISRLKTEKALERNTSTRHFDATQLEEFGISHYLMTAMLLDLWHFPHKMIKLIMQLAPGAQNLTEEASALRHASSLASKLGYEVAGTEDEAPIRQFGLTLEQEKIAGDFISSRLAVFEHVTQA